MRIKSAIRFWLNGELVYNQSIKDYLKQEHFTQKWKPNDNIVVQITDDLRGYFLQILKNDLVVATLTFNRYAYVDKYVYSLSFKPGDYLTGKFTLRIITNEISITGSITDGDLVTGNLSFSYIVFSITGDVTDGDTATGNLQNNLFSEGVFGLSPTPCLYEHTLYWAYGVPWGTGVTMYLDPALTDVVPASYTRIVKSDDGEWYELNTGVVGSGLDIYC